MTDDRAPFRALENKDAEALFGALPTPCYVIDEGALLKNAAILGRVQEETGCRILLAQKAFSNYDFYRLLSPFLAGTEASGLYEARLGKEECPEGEVHVFCGAYREDEFAELLRYADHIVFNSVGQLKKFGATAKAADKSVGLRVNPECSTQDGHAIYDPCAPGSRLGVTRAAFDAGMTPELLSLLDGLHFHTLCEQNADDLKTTLDAVALKFGDVLPEMKWLNFGGGHHVTREDYDIPLLEECIRFAQKTWGVGVYLEPGEAVALNAGFLVTRVLDVTENGDVTNVVLDASAACHMPDVIEMPYLPPLYGALEEGGSVCRLGGPTCLAGDVVGDYAFPSPPQEGDLLVFGDMAIYTTCKNNTFNGMPLPQIVSRKTDGSFEILTDFGYGDFKRRLGRRK